MAKLVGVVVLALLSCLVGVALAADTFTIQGRVYCDTCRAGFETTTTEYIQGAKVKVECKNYTTEAITRSVVGETDGSGAYSIEVKGNADEERDDEEVCEVALVSSPRKDCKEIKSGRDRAPVLLAEDGGMSSGVRYANSLGFLIDSPLAKCGKLLQQYALSDELA